MNVISQYRHLPKEIYIIFTARVISALGSFIYPFLTMFLSRKLGMDESVIGTYLLVSSIVSIPGVIIGGKLADKFSRKTVFMVAQTISALLFFSIGFMGVSTLIPYILIIAFFFNTFAYPALSAMIMDYSKPENRQEAFSLNYLGLNIGIAIGPIIAGILFENFTSWIFWGDAITTLLSVIMVGVALKEKPPEQREIKDNSSEEKAYKGSTISAILKRPTIIVFAVFCSILAFVYSQSWFALPLHMSEIFGVLGSKYFGYLYSVNGIVVVLFTPIILYFTKNFKPVINVLIGGLFYAVGFGMYGFTNSMPIFLFAAVIWTFGEIVASVNTSVYIANHSPVTHRARFQSLFDIIRGAGGALGPYLMGFFLLAYGMNQLWYLMILISVIGCIFLYGLYIYEKKIKKVIEEENI